MSQTSKQNLGDEELQQRICRACNVAYAYPVPHSLASRFYCADCMELAPRIRATFESMNKRIRALASAVEKQEKALRELKSTPET